VAQEKRGSSFLEKEAEFLSDVDELFDFFATILHSEDVWRESISCE